MKSRLLLLAMGAALLGTLALGAMSFDEASASANASASGARGGMLVRVLSGLAS